MTIIFNFKKVCLTLISIVIITSVIGVIFNLIKAEEVVKLPILMYHSVLKDRSKTGKYVITPESFESDLKYLSECGYTSVKASDVINYTTLGTALPPKPYLLTFDDGCYNNLTYILPLLIKYDAYAVISIVGSYSENYSQTGEANTSYGYLRWEDINKLKDSGRVEFANHSYDMHSINKGRIGSKIQKSEAKEEYLNKFSEDCMKTQKLLFENCNVSPVIYTYPFGAFCEESHDFLDKNGFIMTLSCTEGINIITKNPKCLYLMQRLNRPGTANSYEFFSNNKIY